MRGGGGGEYPYVRVTLLGHPGSLGPLTGRAGESRESERWVLFTPRHHPALRPGRTILNEGMEANEIRRISQDLIVFFIFFCISDDEEGEEEEGEGEEEEAE